MRKAIFLLFLFISFAVEAQNSQVKVSLRNGTVIEGEVKEFDALDHITIIVGGVDTTIPMSQVAYVSNIGEQTQRDNKSSTETTRRMEVTDDDPLKDFKGFLLAKGNNVYVESSNSDRNEEATYDKEAAMVIRELLKKDGFWNVVNHRNQAHFVIHYRVNTQKSDMCQLTINSWRSGKTHLLASSKTNESALKNNIIAQDFYAKEIKSLQKKIEKGKTIYAQFGNIQATRSFAQRYPIIKAGK